MEEKDRHDAFQNGVQVPDIYISPYPQKGG